MPIKIVDASALGALVFAEPDAEYVAGRLADSTLAAPELIWFEMASIALKKIKNHPQLENHIKSALLMAYDFNIQLIPVDHLQVIELAISLSLTVYDASYLWLAHKTRGELITLDKALLSAYDRIKN